MMGLDDTRAEGQLHTLAGVEATGEHGSSEPVGAVGTPIAATGAFAAAGSAASHDAHSADGDQEASAPARSEEELAQIRERNAWIIAADQALADARQRSYEGKLSSPARWKKIAVAPQGADPARFAEELLDHIETHEHAEDAPAMGAMRAPEPLAVQLGEEALMADDPLPDPDVTDIVLLYGKSGVYLYSKPLMSHSFAHALFLTAEDDDLATFAHVVREESRTYPRPVAASSFLNPPYLWSAAKVVELFERAMEDEAYADIQLTQTSLNESYFYSTRHLSDAQGKALAEWYGVEKGRNP